ncbi:LysR family transcriptional regulator [Sulfitobacter dubius]|nr:LysR family transcriptional regulator [Sulfitobacter dubius]
MHATAPNFLGFYAALGAEIHYARTNNLRFGMQNIDNYRGLDIKHLTAFRAAILHGTLSAAAHSMGVSQSTVTRMLTELEESLGFALFTRRKGRVSATTRALEFHALTDDFFEAHARLRAGTSRLGGMLSEEIRIVSISVLAMTIVPEISERFLAQDGASRLHVESRGITGYFRKIRDVKTHIGFGYRLGDQPGIEQVQLGRIPFVCALPPEHPLSGQARIHVKDLVGEPVISLAEDELDLFQKQEEYLLEHGVTTRARVSTQSSANAYSMVLRGLGIGLIDPFSADLWRKNGVVVKPLDPILSFDCTASFSRNLAHTPAVKKLLRIAKEVVARYALTT